VTGVAHRSAADETVGRLHRDGANATLAELLRDLGWVVEPGAPTRRGTQLDVVVTQV
jgi:hypothetical protein